MNTLRTHFSAAFRKALCALVMLGLASTVTSVGAFAARILGTLDLFVQAMLETGQSSFQLVEETSGIRSRSSSMTEALGELA